MTSKFNYKKFTPDSSSLEEVDHSFESREIFKESYSDDSECCNDLDPCVCKIESINMIISITIFKTQNSKGIFYKLKYVIVQEKKYQKFRQKKYYDLSKIYEKYKEKREPRIKNLQREIN